MIAATSSTSMGFMEHLLVVDYLSPQIVQDIGLSMLLFVESVVWLNLWINLTAQGILHPIVTRKILHTFSGPILLLHLPFYQTEGIIARCFASLIPILQIVK
jgi:hypothetical protein